MDYHISRAEDVFNQIQNLYLDHLMRDDLTIPEVVALHILSELNYPTIVEFSHAFHISQSNATYLVAKLENKGYVDKTFSYEDKRIARLHLSERYYENLDFFDHYIESAVQKSLNDMSLEEKEAVEKYNKLLIRYLR